MTKTRSTKPVNKTINKSEKPQCFVIMPFGGWFDNYYVDIYIPAIESAGFDAKRADDLYRPGNIVNDIWNYTKESSVVLADLTDKNPNVFYELGLAHAITKPAILITASMEDVPFDLRSLRVIEYNKNSPNWGDILQNKISKALQETLKNPEDAIPPTFLEVIVTNKIEVSPINKELLELKNDMDLLKREVRSTSQIRRIRIEEQIKPNEAELLIENYLKKGLEEAIIVEKLKQLGAPIDWTYKYIKIIKDRLEGIE
jgi:hypothetical protein